MEWVAYRTRSSPAVTTGRRTLPLLAVGPRRMIKLTQARPTLVAISALLLLVTSIVVVFFPGIFTPDVLDMCHQALTDRYTDAHSPIMVGLWGWVDPPVWTLFAASVSVIVGSSYVILRERLAWWTAIVATVAVILAPPVLSFLTVQGKDGWFMASSLMLIACLSLLSRRCLGRWTTLGVWVIAGTAAWSAIGARRNAMFAVFAILLVGTPLASRVSDRTVNLRYRLRFSALAILLAVAATGLILVAQSILTSTVITPSESHLEQWFMRLDLAQMSLIGGEQVYPTELRKLGLSPNETGPEFVGPGSTVTPPPSRPSLSRQRDVDTLRSAWRRTVLDYPILYLRFRLRYAAIILGLKGAPAAVIETPVLPSDLPPEWGISCPLPDPIITGLGPRIERGLWGPQTSPIALPWVDLIVLALASVVVGLRSVAARGLLVLAVLNELSVVFLSIDPIGRYSWPLWVCTALMVALAVARRSWGRWVPRARRLLGTDGAHRNSPTDPLPESAEPDQANGAESNTRADC